VKHGLDAVRLHGQSSFGARQRLLRTVEKVESDGTIGEACDMIGIDCDGLQAARQRLVDPAQYPERLAAPTQRRCVAGIDRQRAIVAL
jgi:hypothetical protein